MERLGPSACELVIALSLAVLASCRGPTLFPEGKHTFHADGSHFSASNGFKVFVLPESGSRVQRLEVRYAVGAAQDPPGKDGLAHLVEHMMFQTKITTSRGDVKVMDELGRVAQGWNAYTNLDSTHYMTQVSSGSLSQVFGIEMSRMALGCKTWDEATFLREREVVRNEIRENHRSPSGEITRLLHETIYPAGHPYHRVVGGTDATLATLTLADVCAFVATYYTPSRTTLFVIGDVNEGEVRELASRWFPAFKPDQQTAVTRPPRMPPGKRQLSEHELDIDLPLLYVAVPLPNGHDLRLVRLAYGSLQGYLEVQAARFEWADNVSVYEVGGEWAPALMIAIELRDASKKAEALDFVWKSFDSAIRNFDQEAPEDKARRWMGSKTGLIRSAGRLGNRGSQYGDYHQFDEKPLFVIGRLQELDNTTPRMVREALRDVLKRDASRVVLIRPRAGASAHKTSDVTYRPSPHRDGDSHVGDDLAETDAPVPIPRGRRLTDLGIRYDLDNGMRVILKPRADALPYVLARLIVDVGDLDDPPGLEGLADAAGSATTDRHTLFGDTQIASAAPWAALELSYRVRQHGVINLDEWRPRMLRWLRRKSTVRTNTFGRSYRAAVYGPDHPYARGGLTEDSIGKITGKRLAEFKRAHHTAANSTLIIVGDFDPDLMRKHISREYGHLEGTRRSAPQVPAPRPKPETLVIGHSDSTSAVTWIEATWLAGVGIDERYAVRLVIERMLGQYLRGLREGSALTYGFSANYSPRAGGLGAWHVSGDVDARRSGEAMRELWRLLRDLQTSPEQFRRAFAMARRKIVEELLTEENTTEAQVARLEFETMYGLRPDFHDELVEKVANVMFGDVQKLIQDELAADHAVFGVYGPPESTAEAQKAFTTARAPK